MLQKKLEINVDRTVWDRVDIRFQYEARMNPVASGFVKIMTEPPGDRHPGEGKFEVLAQGDYDFLLRVHQRTVLAHYSVFFRKGENSAEGRYRFYLLTDELIDKDGKPELILEFEMNRQGIFAIDGEELLCDPASYQRSAVRNIVLTYVFSRLQDRLM